MSLPPLPEPAGFRTRYRSEPGMIGHYPWTYADQRRRKYDRPECEYEDLFTADQVRELLAAAHLAALEEAARMCDETESAIWRDYKHGVTRDQHTEGRSDGAGECAAAIRSLAKHVPPTRTENREK